MSLLERIEELQKKPEAHRRRILIITMAVMIPVILGAWLVTLDLPSTQDKEKKVEIQAPFALVFESFSETYSVFKGKLSNLKSITN